MFFPLFFGKRIPTITYVKCKNTAITYNKRQIKPSNI